MTRHLHRDLEGLKRKILSLSAFVEGQVARALDAFRNRDTRAAVAVIKEDEEIDRRELEVEEECLKILALHQPVAIDLRFIVAVLKMNNDLERIGDLAVNIAEQVVYFCRREPVEIPGELTLMAEKSREMLRGSLDALVNLDGAAAARVLVEDDQVDDMLLGAYREAKKRLREEPEHVECSLSLLFVARHLERMADLATNIAEDVTYMVEGRIVRHRWKGEASPGDAS